MRYLRLTIYYEIGYVYTIKGPICKIFEMFIVWNLVSPYRIKVISSRILIMMIQFLCRLLVLVLFLGLIFYPEDGGDVFLRNVWLFPKLYAVTTQMSLLLLVTAMRNSHPT
jgi:hypothetical protein